MLIHMAAFGPPLDTPLRLGAQPERHTLTEHGLDCAFALAHLRGLRSKRSIARIELKKAAGTRYRGCWCGTYRNPNVFFVCKRVRPRPDNTVDSITRAFVCLETYQSSCNQPEAGFALPLPHELTDLYHGRCVAL